VEFEWDPRKAARNLAKHGIRFADGVTVMQDPLAVTIPDPHSDGEERFVTIGMDEQRRVLARRRSALPLTSLRTLV
jgi:uncharacterized DUF497 family protein